MRQAQVYVTICLLACVKCIHGELFTSSAHLQSAVHAEKDISEILNSYVEQEQARLDKIKQLADNYASHSQWVLTSPDMSLENPVNAFLFIKRFTVNWDRDVLPVLSNNSIDGLLKDINSVRSNLPTYEDLKGAAGALMLLQDVYLLDVATVAHGNMNGFKSPQLSAEDCFELGKILYENHNFYHSTLWMQHALNERKKERKYIEKMKEAVEKDEKEVVDRNLRLSAVDKNRFNILDYIALSHYKLGDLRQAVHRANELLAIYPTHTRWIKNKRIFIQMMRDPNQTLPRRDNQANRDKTRERLTYEALCRGENVQPIRDAHKLTCQYRHNHHPLLLLSPAKEETVHFDPRVVIYHDVISNDEIRQLKNIASQQLKRSKVRIKKPGEGTTATYRTSKSTWLYNKNKKHKTVLKFTWRMEALTGLKMDSAEPLQVANYGMGGRYDPHWDYIPEEYEEDLGNRIATFMTYMTDVEAGGATVFTKLGLKVYPKKGTAVFWYNLYKSGSGDPRTRHAGCPVLVGNKWVANSWIKERGQEFRRPCDISDDIDMDYLDPDEG